MRFKWKLKVLIVSYYAMIILFFVKQQPESNATNNIWNNVKEIHFLNNN